jgi:hypothetical protein
MFREDPIAKALSYPDPSRGGYDIFREKNSKFRTPTVIYAVVRVVVGTLPKNISIKLQQLSYYEKLTFL